MEAARLKNRIAVVTGSESGIGQATAVAFAEEGADVVITYFRNERDGDETRRQVESYGRRALLLPLDQRDPSQVARLFEATHRELGVPTILVNCAGINASGTRIEEMAYEEWDNVMKTNLYGPFLCCQHFIRGLPKGHAHATIVNVTSVHEEIPFVGAGAYDSSKGGLRNLTRTLVLELAGRDINVANIAPGMVLTPMNQEAVDDPNVRAAKAQYIPARRAAESWEIAQAAVYLASRAGRYVHGASLFIDGGLMQNQGQGA
jgi:glucose 1-dehydrogenase